MCGIVGYVGNKKASPIIFEGLRKLEYRGYDSSGMAVFYKKEIHIKKDIGKLDIVNEKLQFNRLKGSTGIGHSRWATHGGVTQENAHPHKSQNGIFTLVHNGIIENYETLRKELLDNEMTFLTTTDTEVIVNLLEYLYRSEKDIKQVLAALVSKLEGAYSLGIICIDFPDMLFSIKQKSPLVIGIGENENFIASDIIPFIQYTSKVIYLENQEIAIISPSFYEIYDFKLNRIQKKITNVLWDEEATEKRGFDHFMLKEIIEQPDVITNIIKKYIHLKENTIDFGLDPSMVKYLLESKRFTFIACGTSWHSSLVGEFMFEEVLRIPCEVEYASEFRYRNPIIEEGTVMIALSQSGETMDTISAIEEVKDKNIPLLSILNVEHSSIDRLSNGSIFLQAGPEIGVASTKAFVAQIAIIYLLMLYIGNLKGIFSKIQLNKRIQDLKLIPSQIDEILQGRDYIKNLAHQYFEKRDALYLGRGINYPIALEGALKLKEVSYIHAEGYPAAELKHGPIALIDKEMPVFIIATKDEKVYKKIKSNIEEIRARNGEVIAIISKEDKDILSIVDNHIPIPTNSHLLTTILATVPFQLLAYYITVNRNFDPDKPRNLAKSVTVE